MRSKVALICVVIGCILLTACPMMPNPGQVGSRDAFEGTEGTPSPAAGGQVSVAFDEARGVAVYINEAGQKFDVAAEEYPGGPLARCVQLADFNVVAHDGDANSLDAKVIIAGTRDDGNPGVWEVNYDDSIVLPQPEQTGDDTARCIVGGDIATLPDGMQVRLGWGYHLIAVGDGGKIIIGYADHPKGFSFNGVSVLPTSTVGVYWRVYRLPYSRFCIVSPPRVLGTFAAKPLPARWTPRQKQLSAVLMNLRQFFHGRLESFIVLPSSLKVVDNGYIVRGRDQEDFSAIAKIDKNDAIEIDRVPDLSLTGLTVSAPDLTTDKWSVSATVTNLKSDTYEADARPSSVQIWLEWKDQPKVSLGTVDIGSSLIPGGVDVEGAHSTATLTLNPLKDLPSPISDYVARLSKGVRADFTVTAMVTADALDFEENLANNTSPQAVSFHTWTPGDTQGQPNLAVQIGYTSLKQVVSLKDTWPFTLTLDNSQGTADAQNVTVSCVVSGPNSSVSLGDTLLVYTVGAKQTLSIEFKEFQKSKILGDLGVLPGANTVTFKVAFNSGKNPIPVATQSLNVAYSELVIDAYNPTGVSKIGSGLLILDLFDQSGNAIPGATDGLGTVTDGIADGHGSNSTDQLNWPRIDYTKGQFDPGTVLYLRITSGPTGDPADYAVRLLLKASATHTYGPLNSSDFPYEPDNSTDQNGIPIFGGGEVPLLSPGIVVKVVTRYLDTLAETPDVVDWIKITLP